MSNLNAMKKDLQKLAKVRRDAKGSGHDHPKAMMTSQQMFNSTATVNFGSARGPALNEANAFLASADVQKFCEVYGVWSTAVELNFDNRYQVRFLYSAK